MLFSLVLIGVVFQSTMASYANNATSENPNSTTTTVPITTRVISTTTLAPTPAPQSTVFYVKSDSGIVCLIMETDATFSIPYSTTNEENHTVTVPLSKPNSTTVQGHCGNLDENMQLSFTPEKANNPWIVTLSLIRSNSSYSVSSISLNYTRDEGIFVNASHAGQRHIINSAGNDSAELFETNLGSYFQCLSELTVSMSEEAKLKFNSLRIEAFRNQNNTVFSGTRSQCSYDSFAHNIVPIIVGCTLAFLILFVLVVYLIARRRAHVGYQTI